MRLLTSEHMNHHLEVVARVGAEAVHHMLELSVVPVLKVLTMCALGSLLAQPRINVITPHATRLLSKLVFTLFLPCLIFTELGDSMTWSNMLQWWFIPVNVLLSYFIGCVAGVVVAVVCKPPPQFFRFTVVMTGIGNSGNLPLAIIGSICHGESNYFGPKCNQSGVAYVALSQWISVIAIYTFVYHMLEPPEDYYELVLSDGDDASPALKLESEPDCESMPSVTSAEWPNVEESITEESQTPLLARVFRYPSLPAQQVPLLGRKVFARVNHRHRSLKPRSLIPDSETDLTYSESRIILLDAHKGIQSYGLTLCWYTGHEGGAVSPKSSVRCLAEPRAIRKIRAVAEKTPFRLLIQPPIIASLLAIAVGIIPKTRELFFGDDALFSVVTDSLTILGAALVPCVMLVLGGTFSVGPPGSSELGLRTTLGISFTRLVVLPPLGIGVVLLALKLGILPQEDKMFVFVLLLQHAMPSAILVGAMTSLRGFAVREASELLFWQYIFAAITVATYIVIFLKIIAHI